MSLQTTPSLDKDNHVVDSIGISTIDDYKMIWATLEISTATFDLNYCMDVLSSTSSHIQLKLCGIIVTNNGIATELFITYRYALPESSEALSASILPSIFFFVLLLFSTSSETRVAVPLWTHVLNAKMTLHGINERMQTYCSVDC